MSTLTNRLNNIEQKLKSTTKDLGEYEFTGKNWELSRKWYGDKVARELHKQAPHQPFGLLTDTELRNLAGEYGEQASDDMYNRLFTYSHDEWERRLKADYLHDTKKRVLDRTPNG